MLSSKKPQSTNSKILHLQANTKVLANEDICWLHTHILSPFNKVLALEYDIHSDTSPNRPEPPDIQVHIYCYIISLAQPLMPLTVSNSYLCR